MKNAHHNKLFVTVHPGVSSIRCGPSSMTGMVVLVARFFDLGGRFVFPLSCFYFCFCCLSMFHVGSFPDRNTM